MISSLFITLNVGPKYELNNFLNAYAPIISLILIFSVSIILSNNPWLLPPVCSIVSLFLFSSIIGGVFSSEPIYVNLHKNSSG